MTASPTPPPAEAGQTSRGGLAAIEQALGGQKRATAIFAVVAVGGVALYRRSKSKTSTSNSSNLSPGEDPNASTDMNSLPDIPDWNWTTLYEQQGQGANPIPPPVASPTAPPRAPFPPWSGGTPPHGPAGPVKAPANDPKLTTDYTVKRGDTLWSLAGRFLGNDAQWPEIYNDPPNRKVIGPDPNLIKPGERLLV